MSGFCLRDRHNNDKECEEKEKGNILIFSHIER